MNNKKYILIFVFAAIMLLTSCRDDAIHEEIKQNLENYEELLEQLANDNDDDYDDNYERDTSRFTPHSNLDDFRGISSIRSILDMKSSKVIDNRLYSSIGKVGDFGYIDLSTGELRHICPDPLCRHTDIEECRFVYLHSVIFTEDNVFYAIGNEIKDPETREGYQVLNRVDLSNGTVSSLYRDDLVGSVRLFDLINIHGDTIYALEFEIDALENRMANMIFTLLKIDAKNSEIIRQEVPAKYGEIPNIIRVTENKIYLRYSVGLVTTDLNFENEQIIYTENHNESLGAVYYDENTNEMFLRHRDYAENTGHIYVYSEENGMRRLDMPSDNIDSFQLTNSKIYYMCFDPDSDIFDEDKKVYVTDRATRKETELVYEFDADLYSYDYILIGDYIYFRELEQVYYAGLGYIPEATGRIVRINYKENTVKYMSLD